MMILKRFEEFLREGIVRKQQPNIERAESLLKETEDKKQFLEDSIKIIPVGKMYPNFIVDSCYDILIETLRAIMFIEGFNSGTSHEAEVSYLRILGFEEYEVRFMNELRYRKLRSLCHIYFAVFYLYNCD